MEGEQKILFLFVQMMSGDSTSSASSDDTDYQPQEGVVLLDPCTEDDFLPKVDEAEPPLFNSALPLFSGYYIGPKTNPAQDVPAHFQEVREREMQLTLPLVRKKRWASSGPHCL